MDGGGVDVRGGNGGERIDAVLCVCFCETGVCGGCSRRREHDLRSSRSVFGVRGGTIAVANSYSVALVDEGVLNCVFCWK